jgi:membrane associated rhomboid family serine protease
MLVIPFAQEENVVRRTPWVAYGLVVLNVAIFMMFGIFSGGESRQDEVQKTRREAMELLSKHPHLTVPPELVPLLVEETRVALDRARARALRKGVPDAVPVAELQGKLNGLAAKLQEQFRRVPSQTLGYVPARPRPLALLTSMFMHAGWMHLFGNMLFLILTAPFIEDVYGRPLFAGFYVAGGVAATLIHAAAQSGSQAGLVGASGAIAAVMGAFLLRFGRRRIGFLLLPVPILPWIRTQFLMPAFVVIPFWFAQQLLFAHSDRASSTAWWAHIGGFSFGIGFALLFRLLRAEERFIDPHITKKIELRADPSLEQLVDARVEGRFDDAQALLAEAMKRDPNGLDVWAEAYELAVARQDAAGAGRALVRLLDLYGKAGEPELASRLVWGGTWTLIGAPLPVQAYLSLAAWLEKEGDGRRALELYEEASRVAPHDPKTLRALVRRGEIHKDGGNVGEARLAFELAQAHPTYGEPWKSKVEAALASLPVKVVFDDVTEAELV